MKYLILLLLPFLLYGGFVVVPNDEDYYSHSANNVELIYSDENRKFAKQALSLEQSIHSEYEHFYGYKLDQKLYVGLISKNNQIANGFSTQVPFNMQVNYIGGALMVDYFSTTSWLNTLLYHETAHNYQMNAKKSKVSRIAYNLMGNTGVSVIFPILPIFVTPNIMLSSYLSEGNAVLNESWHDNGGRLYSGIFLAMTYLQSQAGNITPALMYDSTLEFPYGERFYIVGGFFQLYLAERFGLEKSNLFFYNHSASWLWPFRTNYIFKQTFGITFEEALADFDAYLSKKREGFVMQKGNVIAHSKRFYGLNNDTEEIFFLTNEKFVSAPDLLHVDKKSKKGYLQSGHWFANKVIKKDEEYLTQASAYTNPTKIYQGLFGKNGFIEEGTESKVIQGYLSDGRAVYFDVPSSFDQPQLYVGDTYYGQVNSSVIIDKEDNLYYFVQEGKKRTLYKNKMPLYSMPSYFGFVCDVDSKGDIYFVSNSDKGSTLFRLTPKGVERVSDADNIVDMRLLDDDTMLVAAIGEDEYYFVSTPMQIRKQAPYELVHFFESKPYFAKASQIGAVELDKKRESSYIAPLDMHFSSLYPTFGYSGEAGLLFNISANFADPLLQNIGSFYLRRDLNEVTLGGASYTNSVSLLSFGVNGYGLIDAPDANRSYIDINGSKVSQGVENRAYGVNAFARLPIIEAGYLSSDMMATYYMDYDSNARQLSSLNFSLDYLQVYGLSMFYNLESSLRVYGSLDRDDSLYGASYRFSHSLPLEFYAGFKVQYSKGELNRQSDMRLDRGVKVTRSNIFESFDPTTIEMAGIDETTFVKEAGYGSVDMKKVFNFSHYFFTFPLSLRREVVGVNYSYYRLKAYDDSKSDIQEAQVSLSFETLLLNNFVVPMGVTYIYNDTAKNEHQFGITLGLGF